MQTVDATIFKKRPAPHQGVILFCFVVVTGLAFAIINNHPISVYYDARGYLQLGQSIHDYGFGGYNNQGRTYGYPFFISLLMNLVPNGETH